MNSNSMSCFSRPLALMVVAGACVCGSGGAASAVDGRLYVSDARCTTPGHLVIGVGAVDVTVPVGAMMPMGPKRDACVQHLGNAGFDAAPEGAGGCLVRGLSPGDRLRCDVGNTAEVDRIQFTLASAGESHFIGHFDPMNTRRTQPAIFTAGIVTDVGVLSAQVSAQELSFQTDGPIICQALFQRLAPRAPQYGAQVNYAGDRLEVYFDPAYTVTQGGIIFGTDSPSQGCGGSMVVPPPPRRLCDSVDFDCDGDLGTDADIEAFFRCLAGQCPLPPCDNDADFDNDGDMGTDLDIERFFRALGGEQCPH
jgi:hypothetical protein